MKKTAGIIMILALLLSGCGRKPEPSEPQGFRVVTGIAVTFENGPIQARRIYTTSSKMRAILHYLRWIDPYGQPEVDPEAAEGSSILVELTYSDGGTKTYLQKADRYLLEEGQPWRKINPEHAVELSRLLGEMSSDEIGEPTGTAADCPFFVDLWVEKAYNKKDKMDNYGR